MQLMMKNHIIFNILIIKNIKNYQIKMIFN